MTQKTGLENFRELLRSLRMEGQFQVVIGNHVGDVYAQVAKELDLDNSDRVVEEPKQGVLNRVIATMSAVFAPFIYVLAAAGLLQGVLILINLAVPSFANTGTL